MTQEKILNFIATFSSAQELFTNGCCYYFAVILKERFDAEIVYDPVENHFAGRIFDKVYDVTGLLKEPNRFLPWKEYTMIEPLACSRIKRYCIEF